nr:interleukin-1 receptor-like 2 isoform X4 [Oryctolagus cuniculus]
MPPGRHELPSATCGHHPQPSMGMRCLLVCGVSIALPLFVGADVCKEIGMQNETPSVGQPFAFNCTFPPITFGKVNVLWYKNSRKIPVSQNVHSRIHQDHTWILFLPLAWEDSGIYKCVIEETDHCYRIHINLTVAKRSWCDNSGTSVSTLSDEYKQILHVGQDDSLMCHLHFPKSCVLDSIKWYKDCKEIESERFISLGLKLSVSNVSAGDRGNYACVARLTHLGKEYTVLNSITVNVKRVGNGGRIPKIIYPKNNSIEVQLAPDFQAYLIGGLTALTVVMLSLVGVYNVFKIDIVLWYRSTFHPNGTTEDGKLYDAYILYPKPQRDSQSHDVDTLVWKILPEVLERQCGYKLFIFGRDEFPGQAVASVIDENIKLCRRLMVIVVPESPSFSMLKNMSEEQIAVYNALIQDGMKVILIELEKIEDYAAMPESIQYIKQKHGAIQWSGGFAEQSQAATAKFWKKVRYHMPSKRYPHLPLSSR